MPASIQPKWPFQPAQAGFMNQEEGLQTAAPAAAGPVLIDSFPFADVPHACFAMITQYLSSWDLLALFSTCHVLASMVVHTCKGLTLTPSEELSFNRSKRAIVWGLAAGCRNIHLHLRGTCPPLDLDLVWPCITHLTMCDVPLNAKNIQATGLGSLSRLCTLSFTNRTVKPGPLWHGLHLDATALDNVIKAGGLGMLTELRCMCKDTHSMLAQLAPILGHRITSLVVRGLTCNIKKRSASAKWLLVKHLELMQHCPHALQVAAKFPSITHLQLCGGGVLCTRGSRAAALCSRLETLQFSNTVHSRLLKALPLQCVQHLQVLQGLHIIAGRSQAALLRHMQQCHSVELIPVLAGASTNWGLQAELPVFEITGKVTVDMLAWLSQHMQGSALRLNAGGRFMSAAALFPVLYNAPHIQTLWLSEWLLEGNADLISVLHHLPTHVSHLVLGMCNLPHVLLVNKLTQSAPPVGLKRLTIGFDKGHRNLPAWATFPQLVGNVKQTAAERWPGVEFEILVS